MLTATACWPYFFMRIDCQCLLVQTMISGELRNLASIVVLQLVDITLLGVNIHQKEKVLQVLIVTER